MEADLAERCVDAEDAGTTRGPETAQGMAGMTVGAPLTHHGDVLLQAVFEFHAANHGLCETRQKKDSGWWSAFLPGVDGSCC
eukprot:3306435-Rhodomonas_salina.2